MHPHLHVGTSELIVFALYLLVAGGLLRLIAAYLAQMDSPAAQRIAGALGFIY